MSRTGAASGSLYEGGVGGFGHIGGAVHPVRNRRPGIFGYRLDEIVQAFVLADGDGEADVHPAADGGHGVGIEAAVGTHGELPAGPAAANPAHRLTQELELAPRTDELDRATDSAGTGWSNPHSQRNSTCYCRASARIRKPTREWRRYAPSI